MARYAAAKKTGDTAALAALEEELGKPAFASAKASADGLEKQSENNARYAAAKKTGDTAALAALEEELGKPAFASAKASADGLEKHSKNMALLAAARLNGPDAEAALKAKLGEAFEGVQAGANAGVRNLATASQARASEMVVELTITVKATGNTIKVNINKIGKLILTYGHIRKLFGGPGKCTLGATRRIEETIGEGNAPDSKAKKTEVWQSRGTLVDTALGRQTRWKPTENSKSSNSGTKSYAQVVREFDLDVTQSYGPRNKAGS